MTQNAKKLWILMVVLTLCVPGLWAQRVNPVGPAAPIGEDEESSSKRLDEPVKDAAKPDTRPLGGAETFSLGRLTEGQKYFRFNINASQRAGTTTGTGNRDVSGTSSLNGSFELRRSLPNSDLTAEYRGGGYFHTDHADRNTSVHLLSLRQTWQKGRWNFLLGDQLNYTPDSPFSLTMAGQLLNIAFNVGGESNISPIFIPGQHVITGRTTRFGNSSVGQVQYRLGPRTSVFATAGYGFLNFSDPTFTDFTQKNALVGFERQITSSDSLGVNYGFSQFVFSKGGGRINNHTVRLAYGRRITSRMALEVSGGPQISQFADPLLGPTQRLYWTVDGSLAYTLGRSRLGFSYRHALNGGSGVLAGAQGDSINASWNRRLTPRWNMDVNLGYSRSTGLRGFTTSVVRASYDTEYGSIRMSRKLASDRSVYFGYYVTHQTSTVAQGGFPLHHV
ncbi:MAG: hypothetical protein ACRD2M_05290, partial [Terriglobales bacterium]